jgi:MFS family permease
MENPAAGRSPVAATALGVMLAGALLPTPLFELYHRAWGLTPAEISIVFAVYSASLIPALLFLGGLSDTLGRRQTILLACGILTLGVLILAFAGNLFWLLVGRIVEGIALGIGTGAAAAAIREWTHPHERNRSGTVTVLAASGGSALGVLLGGSLAQYAPYPFALPYFAFIAVLAGVALAVATVPQAAPPQAVATSAIVRIAAPIRRPFFIASTQAFIGWAVFAIFIALVPSFLARALDLHNLLIGAFVITAIQIGSVAASLVGGRLARRAAIAIAMGGLGAGVWLLLYAVAVHNLPLVVAASIVAGAGGGLSYMTGIDLVGSIAPAGRRAETLSGFLVTCYLGYSLPAVAVGVAATRFGLFPSFVGAAVVLGIAAIAIVLLATDANLQPREAATTRAPRSRVAHSRKDG